MNLEERKIQISVVEWAKWHEHIYPDLKNLYANNAESLISEKEFPRIKQVLAIKKKMGQKKGLPDLCLAVASRGYHGCYIEIKTSSGKFSAEQIEWAKRLHMQGYFIKCGRSFEEIISIFKYYLKLEF